MKHQARVRHQVARDLQALVHAAREGRAASRRCAPGRARRAPSSRMAVSRSVAVVALAQAHQALADVGAGRDVHAQAVARVLLRRSPSRCAPAARRSRFASGVHVELGGRRGAGRARGLRSGCRRAGEQLQQRGLARAGFADDGQHLAGVAARRAGLAHRPRCLAGRVAGAGKAVARAAAPAAAAASSFMRVSPAARGSSRCPSRRTARLPSSVTTSSRKLSVRRTARRHGPALRLRRGGPRSPGSAPSV